MKINLETTEQAEFIDLIAKELNFQLSPTGKKLRLKQQGTTLKIVNTYEEATIYYAEKPHLFRGLTLWSKKEQQPYTYEETPNFEKIGPMIDTSRNGVPRIPKLKDFLFTCCKMGLNTCMLYMEDTYEIPEYPYFGHYRGRYSQEELQSLDAYATTLGIELIPAIQTLAHLKNPLKWGFTKDFQDTDDILLVGEQKTYDFLKAALTSISACFTTKKIHIGMDEAMNLGLGKFLEKNGLQNRFELMAKHLTNVFELCQKQALTPMIWSDMFFRIGSTTNDYYDPHNTFPGDITEKIPDLTLVYWDYYHHHEQEYLTMFEKHKKLQRPVYFAGGVWTWNGLAPNYGKSFETTKAGLFAAKKYKIPYVFATLWGDDGSETPLLSSLLGLQQFSEEQFQKNPDLTWIKKQFQLFHGEAAETFLLLDQFDQVPSIPCNNPQAANPSKLLFYQDILYGLYEKDLAALDVGSHYSQLAKKLRQTPISPRSKMMAAYYQQLATVLSHKASMGTNLQQSYQQSDMDALQKLKQDLFVLATETKKLYLLYRNLWFEWNKPFGFEIIDLRYGALLQRINTSIWRLDHFLTHKLEHLEELEAPSLFFDSFSTSGIGRNLFHGIYSPGKISDV